MQYANRYAQQAPKELEHLRYLLWAMRPDVKVVMEIGIHEGGTLAAWADLYPKAKLVGIDLNTKKLRSELHNMLEGRELFLYEGDSTSGDFQAHIHRVFEQIPVDFLFIDGGHDGRCVRADFDSYSKLVRPGGIIALHDICAVPKHNPPVYEIREFWDELKRTHGCRIYGEIFDPCKPKTHSGGIGYLWV